jgi:dipeptidyl-peptidase-4
MLLARSAPQAHARPQAAAQQLTVERIYSAPDLSGQILRGTSWSPDGKWLSYIGRDAGGQDQVVWVVDAANGNRSVLVDAQHLRDMLLPPASRGQQTGLGRITPPRFLWAPNSQALLFISAKQLFWYDLQTKTSRKLLAASVPNSQADDGAELDDAKISPDGKLVSFLRNHDVWCVVVATNKLQQLTHGGTEELRNGELDWVYPEELDLHTAYWWSPDSSRIAFMQFDERNVEKYPLVDFLSPKGDVEEERYPVAGSPNPIARVGVVAIGGGEPRWMDTGDDKSVLLARVDWLRDSKRIAIQRFNRGQNHLDLLFADATIGKSQPVLSERDPYWINVSDDLYFFGDGKRFLWSSERSGVRDLYVYDLEGKQLEQLNRGGWVVDHVVGVDENADELYLIGNAKSVLERHLYRLHLSGRTIASPPFPEILTHDSGTHEVSLAPGSAHFLDTYSTSTHPPMQTLNKSDGSAVSVLAENKDEELAQYQLSPVDFLQVPGADGTELQAEMIRPPNFDPSRRYPVLVYVYGGPGVQNVMNAWEGSTFLWNEMMAQKGFIIFAVDNHGASGYGHRFETAIFHRMGQVELADQVAAVNWLDRQPFVDRARVGIWGWSYGGTMACLAMLKAGDTFKAGFAGAPVTDWRQYDTIYTERYMGTPQENPVGYHDGSAINYASGLRGKLLIAHATGDDNVHFANTVELAQKLAEAQKYAEIQIYAGEGHGISDAASRIHIFNRMTQFFLENLAP